MVCVQVWHHDLFGRYLFNFLELNYLPEIKNMPENEAYCSDWGTEKCFIKICVLYFFIHIFVQWFERWKKNDNVKASAYLYTYIFHSFLGAVFFPPLSVQIEINRGGLMMLSYWNACVYSCLSTIHNSLR